MCNPCHTLLHELDGNSRVFKKVSLTQQLIWDKISCLASIWCKVLNHFKRLSLTAES